MTTEIDVDDIAEPAPPPRKPFITRRGLLGAGAALAFGGGGLGAGYALTRTDETRTADGLRKLKLAWNAAAVCLSPVVLAKDLGIFKKHGLEIDLVNYSGSSDQLLESISTGKADAGVGMILRWIKPLEQGFDVKLIAGTHGGCIRVAGSRKAGISEDPKSLRGKRLGLSEISGTSRNAFSVLLKKQGIDPDKEITWRAFPQPLLGEAIRKGEVDAIADSDPILYIMEKESKGDLVEVLTNLTPPWDKRVCCVVGVSGSLVRSERHTAKALSDALVSAAAICNEDPALAAKSFQPYAKASIEDLVAVLKKQTHDNHPIGQNLRSDIALYADELRDVGVMRKTTLPNEFANRIVEDLYT